MADPSFWSIALPTVAGAVVGGGISGIVSFRIFKDESRERAKVRLSESEERYEVRLTEALATVLNEMMLFPKSLQSSFVTEKMRGDFPLISALDVAEIVAKNKDLEMTRIIKKAVMAHRDSSIDFVVFKMGMLSGLLGAWRSGEKTYDYCYAETAKFTYAEKPDVS